MPLSAVLKDYLVAYGYSRGQVESFTGETRLLHDLGWLDDNLDDDLMNLFLHFNVDVSSPPQGPFTPSAGTWDNLVLALFERTRFGERIKKKYKPITLDMVDRAIATGKWTSGGSVSS